MYVIFIHLCTYILCSSVSKGGYSIEINGRDVDIKKATPQGDGGGRGGRGGGRGGGGTFCIINRKLSTSGQGLIQILGEAVHLPFRGNYGS